MSEKENAVMDLRESRYVSLLNEFPRFATGASDDVKLEWSYMPADAPPLVELREKYRLAEKIEGLSEIDAILKLLNWAHEAMAHDGGAANPEPRNALNILRVCEETKAAVNCRMKAIVLNEALLSVGVKSRYVTCLPADFDGDCHVIVMAFVSAMRKWIAVDPTHDTYFMGADGTILDILEARESYRAGFSPKNRPIRREMTAPLYCDGIECASYDEFYAVYMSKNCFRFSCPLNSECGVDSKEDAKIVFLNPLEYDLERGANDDDYGSRTPVGILRTCDADQFLAAPVSGHERR